MNAARFSWSSAALSDVGLVRRVNQDACLALPEQGLWVVADGMGGHACGEIASAMIVEALAAIARPATMDEFVLAVRLQLKTVNLALRHQASTLDVGLIGSTVVVLLAIDSECAVLWAGDSRAYLLQADALHYGLHPGLHPDLSYGLRQLTRDHSHRIEHAMAAETGMITGTPAHSGAGTAGTGNNVASSGSSVASTATNVASTGITRAVGAAEILCVDEIRLAAHDGDMLLLCSDGLSREVSDYEIACTLASRNTRHAAQALVALALQRGGRDNVSVVVITAADHWSADKTQLNPAC